MAQFLAIGLADYQAGQDVGFGIAETGAAIGHQNFQIIEKLGDGGIGRIERRLRDRGLQSAQNRQRPAPQRAAIGLRHAKKITDDLNRDRRCEILDKIAFAPGLKVVKQAFNQGDKAVFHLGNSAGAKCTLQDAPNLGVQRRVVEDEAGGMMFIGQRLAELRQEFLAFVGAEPDWVFVDLVEIGIAGQEYRAIRHGFDRGMVAQCPVIAIGIVVKIGGQGFQIEVAGNRDRVEHAAHVRPPASWRQGRNHSEAKRSAHRPDDRRA